MKCRAKQSLMKRVNSHNSFTNIHSLSHQPLHRTTLRRFSIVPFLMLSMAAGLGTTTARAQTRVYVTNFLDNTVSVIDSGSNTVVATIVVGGSPLGIAITPDGTRAYVTTGTNTVSAIDTGTNIVVATIPVGSIPQMVAITPDGTRAYVTSWRGQYRLGHRHGQ